MLKKYIILISILCSFSYGTTFVEDLNYKIKTESSSETLKKLYSEYNFDQVKDILTFYNINKFYSQFNELYNTLSYEQKINIIEVIIDYPNKYNDLLYNMDLYSKLFTYSNNYNIQEYQFKVYDLLLANPKFYLDVLKFSKITNHDESIFNPYNLLSVDTRYLHYIKKFVMAEYPISYINSIQYMFLNDDLKLSIQKLGMKQYFENNLNKLKHANTTVYLPIVVSSIFYDKSNEFKSINVNYSFYVKTDLSYFVNNVNKNGFIAKYSYDLLKTYLKDGIITNENLIEYLKLLGLDLTKLTISDKNSFVYIEVLENNKKENFIDVETLLKKHSTTFIY